MPMSLGTAVWICFVDVVVAQIGVYGQEELDYSPVKLGEWEENEFRQ